MSSNQTTGYGIYAKDPDISLYIRTPDSASIFQAVELDI